MLEVAEAGVKLALEISIDQRKLCQHAPRVPNETGNLTVQAINLEVLQTHHALPTTWNLRLIEIVIKRPQLLQFLQGAQAARELTGQAVPGDCQDREFAACRQVGDGAYQFVAAHLKNLELWCVPLTGYATLDLVQVENQGGQVGHGDCVWESPCDLVVNQVEDLQRLHLQDFCRDGADELVGVESQNLQHVRLSQLGWQRARHVVVDKVNLQNPPINAIEPVPPVIAGVPLHPASAVEPVLAVCCAVQGNQGFLILWVSGGVAEVRGGRGIFVGLQLTDFLVHLLAKLQMPLFGSFVKVLHTFA